MGRVLVILVGMMGLPALADTGDTGSAADTGSASDTASSEDTSGGRLIEDVLGQGPDPISDSDNYGTSGSPVSLSGSEESGCSSSGLALVLLLPGLLIGRRFSLS